MSDFTGEGWPPVINRRVTDGRGSLEVSDEKVTEFRRKIQRNDDGCWEWSGPLTQAGYGRLNIVDRYWYTHRLSYELHVGVIPSDRHIDHLCRNRKCCNPAHLEPVTSRENTLRSPVSKAAVNAVKTHCDHGHELADDNLMERTLANGQTGRRCRTCHTRQVAEAGQRRTVRLATARTGGHA